MLAVYLPITILALFIVLSDFIGTNTDGKMAMLYTLLQGCTFIGVVSGLIIIIVMIDNYFRSRKNPSF